MTHEFTVVIATGGDRPELLRRTLDSVSKAAKPGNYARTIIIENGGDRNVETMVQSFRESLATEYIYRPEGNKSKALNEVLEIVPESLLLFLDDDVVIHGDLLMMYAEAASEREKSMFFGGPVAPDYVDGEPLPWVRPYLPPSARGLQWHDLKKVDRPLFLGANWAAFTADLKAAGGFDPDRGPGAATGSTGQETTMQERLLARGIAGHYVPEAWVWHHVPAERCSEQWAIARSYRNGLSEGLAYVEKGKYILGWPIDIWRMRAHSWARNVAAALSCYHPWRFKAKWWRSHTRGFMKGFAARQQQE